MADYYDCACTVPLVALWPLTLLSDITNPMDFQTMQRKVKQKAYKSKREFQDDLDLIWTNCFTYNALEVRSHVCFATL